MFIRCHTFGSVQRWHQAAAFPTPTEANQGLYVVSNQCFGVHNSVALVKGACNALAQLSLLPLDALLLLLQLLLLLVFPEASITLVSLLREVALSSNGQGQQESRDGRGDGGSHCGY